MPSDDETIDCTGGEDAWPLRKLRNDRKRPHVDVKSTSSRTAKRRQPQVPSEDEGDAADEEDEGIASRRHPRHPQQRVLFAEVMAQEREISAIARDKKVSAVPRKGEKLPEGGGGGGASNSKKKRAEERRSQRQALRRAMSPRSPDSRGRRQDMRTGVSVVVLDDDEDDGAAGAASKRRKRFANNQDAIQDSALHSTAWRHVQVEDVPLNVLPSRADVPLPFATGLDRSLSSFDDELEDKCRVTTAQYAPPLTPRSGSIGEARDLAQLDERVAELVGKISPLIKKAHAARVNTLLEAARVQIASYLSDLPDQREMAMSLNALPLDITRLEKVAARQLLRNTEFSVNDAPAPFYNIGRGESAQSERQIYPDAVIHLSTIAPIRRSTTYVASRGTLRVDDDPIIRYVPYFNSAVAPVKSDMSQFEGFAGSRKETLVGCDDETNEYIIRHVVAQLDGSPAVFDAVKRLGLSDQPMAEFADIKRRILVQRLQGERLREVDRLKFVDAGETAETIAHAVDSLVATSEQRRRDAGLYGLRDRLGQPAKHLQINHLHHDGSAALGLRSASQSSRIDTLSLSYQEFFCRRCFKFNCRNHGTRQPIPAMRVDPKYPFVRAVTKIARSNEGEKSVPAASPPSSSTTAQDGDVASGSDIHSTDEHPETVDGHEGATDSGDAHSSDAGDISIKNENHDYPEVNSDQENVAEFGKVDVSEDDTEAVKEEENIGYDDFFDAHQIRRSQRSHTAASTKASTLLQSQRPRDKKKSTQPRVRAGPNADASEYLGFDRFYRTLTADEKTRLLSPDIPCSSACAKSLASSPTSVGETTQGRQSAEAGKSTGWEVEEIILLDKLVKTIGKYPCVLARILATKSCEEIAEFTRQQQVEENANPLTERLLHRYGPDRDRERGYSVAGNSYDHLRRTRNQRVKDRGSNHEYVPCNHAGISCNTGGCSCMRRDHFCSKACSCTLDCSNRFPGCRCGPGQCGTDACPCYFALRECDPDVCVSCGACELPVLLANGLADQKPADNAKLCGNVNILRGRFRRIAIAPSATHGWGAFARESIKKGEFIYEYTGSLLSQDEAERRGNVYDKSTVSFLFDLTEDSVVDATRKGNKSKFANHDSNSPKCFARIMFVNGEHRIGIYAKEDIEEGEELFFNYGHHGVIPDWSQARIAGEKPSNSTTPSAVATIAEASST